MLFDKNTPETYQTDIDQLNTSDRASATVFNRLFQKLISNALFLKDKLDVFVVTATADIKSLQDNKADRIDVPTTLPASDVYTWAKQELPDTTLEAGGFAADAKVVGDAINTLSAEKADKTEIPISLPASDVYMWAKEEKPDTGLNTEGKAADSKATGYTIGALRDATTEAIQKLTDEKADKTEIPTALPSSDVPAWAKQTAPDTTLSVSGEAADAKEVGDRLGALDQSKAPANHNHDTAYAAKDSEHTHTNADVLKGITAEKVSNWDAAFDEMVIRTSEKLVVENTTAEDVDTLSLTVNADAMYRLEVQYQLTSGLIATGIGQSAVSDNTTQTWNYMEIADGQICNHMFLIEQSNGTTAGTNEITVTVQRMNNLVASPGVIKSITAYKLRNIDRTA